MPGRLAANGPPPILTIFCETGEWEPTHEISKLGVNGMYLSSKNNMQDIST